MGSEIRPDFYGSIDDTAADAFHARARAATPPATATPGVIFQRQSSTISDVRETDKETEAAADRLHKKLALFCLALTYFTVMCAYSMIAPFFPAEGKKKGANGTITGLIFAIFPLTVFFCSPIAAYMIPRVGLKRTLVGGLMIEGIAQIAFGFLDVVPGGVVYIILCFLIRVVMGVGSSASSTASFSILSVTFHDNLATSLGILETFGGFGMMAGPPIGGLLYSVGGYKVPFLVLGCVIFVAVLLVSLTLPAKLKSENEPSSLDVSFWTVMSIPGVIIVSILIIVGGIVLTFLDPTLASHLSKYHLSSAEVGLVFLIAPALYAGSAPLFGWITDAHDKRYMMATGCFLCGLGYFFLGPFPLLPTSSFPRLFWFNCVALGVVGFSIAPMFVPALPDYNLSTRNAGLPDDLAVKSIVSGIFNSAFNIGGIIGPTAGGSMAQYLNFAWASSILSFALFLLAAVIVVFTVIERRQRRKRSHTDSEQDKLLSSTA